MRAVLQRVSRASVSVEGSIVGSIDGGLLVLAGVHASDVAEDARWLADKIVGLRIFPDESGKMNRSVLESGGAVLLVSQFTLHADARKGRRPSFTAAAPPQDAIPRLLELRQRIEELGVRVATGRFGAHMKVELLNDGPVTILLDSEERRGATEPRTRSEGALAEPRSTNAAPEEPRSRSDGAQEANLARGRFRLIAPGSPLEHIPLVLASGSPRRRELLRELGVSFTVHAPEVDESTAVEDAPEEHARIVAERKARAIADRFRESILLAADTIVVAGGRILGKPGDDDEAAEMLRTLSGRAHTVMTAVCVAHPARDRWRGRVVSTRVRFREIADDEIRRYVASGEPFGKAGGYAIQGLGALLVQGIEGDYSNVVGLPLGATLDLLEEVLDVAADTGTAGTPGGTAGALDR